MLRFASQALRSLIGGFAERFAVARISKVHFLFAQVSNTALSNVQLQNRWFTAFVKTKLLIGVVLLQLVAANVGAHQLHSDTEIEEGGQHSHLQLTAQVTTLSQCDISEHLVDAHGSFSTAGKFDAGSHDDSHLVASTETQEIDICLDCQCHGGHATLLGGITPLAHTHLTDSPVLLALNYFPPESLPSYRPPIV